MTPVGPTVETMQLAVRYGSRGDPPALSPTTLTVESGEWVALLGPNGSGKSTLLKCIATLVRQTEGTLRLFDKDLHADTRSMAEARRNMGVVFQHGALDVLLTVRENLTLVAACFGIRQASSRIEHIAESLGIADRLGDRVGTLSGGLMRRADLARALLPGPSLLLLDEPTTGLDLKARQRFLETLHALRATQTISIVFATHQMDEAEAADRVVMMARGTVVADDSPESFTAKAGPIRLTIDGDPPAQIQQQLGARYPDGSYALGPDGTSVLGQLAASRCAFRVGPATLGDIYLERTGERLVEHA